MQKEQEKRNRNLALSLASLVAGMLMLSYASVPLYDLFCRATGFGGTPKVASSQSSIINDREITVRFNSDVDRNLSWRFVPEQTQVKVKVGENGLAFFSAENITDESIVGMATYNVTPEKAGAYFMKVNCFCFDKQVIKPHEKKRFPVSFYIDPEIVKDRNLRDVHTITLSYTFFKYSDQNIQSEDKKLAN